MTKGGKDKKGGVRPPPIPSTAGKKKYSIGSDPKKK
jgi:hypothetical protein